MNLKGLVRRVFSGGRLGLGEEKAPSLTTLGALAVEQVLPPKGLRAAAGCRFAAVVGNGATFKAPITAWPTTTATWALYNGEDPGGKSLLIDTVGAFLASGTAAAGFALIGAVATTKLTTIPSAYSGTILSSLSGRPANSKALLANNLTIPTAGGGAQPAWHVLEASGANAANATIGGLCLAKLDGGILVPPGYAFYVDIVSGAGTTPLFGVSVTWDEVQADLE